MARCVICSSYVPQPRTLLHAIDARIKQVRARGCLSVTCHSSGNVTNVSTCHLRIPFAQHVSSLRLNNSGLWQVWIVAVLALLARASAVMRLAIAGGEGRGSPNLSGAL